jgi:hypothetical protein
MSTGAKLAIGAVVLFCMVAVVGMLGVFYAAHRVSQKIHQVASSLTDSSTSDTTGTGISNTQNSSSPGSSFANPCRYLSKQDVSKAIGLEIVATQAEGDGCSYLATGTQADMTAKHVAAMSGGTDANTQKTIQQYAGTMFKAFAAEKPDPSQDTSGTVPVLVLSIRQGPNADAEMRLNAKVLGALNSSSQGLQGIGNQAFVTGDSLMMIRKDDKIVRIMYMTCPCNTKQIKPLAQKLVASL